MKKPESKTAIGYCRVSTAMQAESGWSLPEQENRIKAYCAAQGLELVDLIIESKSAKNLDRPEFQTLLDMTTQQPPVAHHVVVCALDRAFRSTIDCLQTVDLWQSNGVHLHSISQSINTSSPIGIYILTTFAALATLERQTTAERVKNGLRQCRESGFKTGGHTPYGYTAEKVIIPTDNPENPKIKIKLIENPEQQKIIRKIVSLNRKGLTSYAIAKQLNDLEVPTVTGSLWQSAIIIKILKAHAA
jgi:site-specific DNA recombinase